MSETRVQFNTIVSNQLPAYVREDFPLISELLKQYYLGQEYQGGPVDLIQNIDRYIKRAHGKEKVEYVHPLLEEALKETYGIIVYQEQVMLV